MILDNCHHDLATLAQSLHFIPLTGDEQKIKDEKGKEKQVCKFGKWYCISYLSSTHISVFLYNSEGLASEIKKLWNNSFDLNSITISYFLYSAHQRQYDIISVIGMGTSRAAVMTANLLSIFKIPNLGVWATSDELSDKSRFEYFMRLVPPDKMQVNMK